MRITLPYNSPGPVGGGDGGSRLSVVAATSVPTDVVEGQILVITSASVPGFYVQMLEPTNPTTGDVWITLSYSSVGIIDLYAESPYLRLFVSEAKQYTGNAWGSVLTAYVGTGTGWVQFCGLPAIGTPLSEFTWAQIAEVSASGNASQYWTIGSANASRTLQFFENSGTLAEYPVKIIAYNHDDLSDGSGKAGITFALDCVTTDSNAMSSSNSNSGGYAQSIGRTIVGASFPTKVMTDVQNVLKLVNKQSNAGGGSSSLTTTSEKMWLFSENEIWGSSSYGVVAEGTYYNLGFPTQASRVGNNISGVAKHWFTRSAYGTNYYIAVYTDGTPNILAATTSNASMGFRFGFCV